jgi:glycogen debranching enzyme
MRRGDRRISDGLHRYLHETWQTDSDGLAIVRHGEWSWGDWGTNIDLEALTSCWYYLALKAEKEFARMLGKSDDEKLCETMMQKMRDSFDRRFWNGEAYRSPAYKRATDDRTQAMAVLSGLASKDKYPAIAAVLEKERHASPYMEKYVLEALCMMGCHTQALDRMKSRYSNMLSHDCSTLFEGWGIGSEGYGGGTINHAWSGGPLTILSQQICGITPTSPGFRTVRIEPRMGYLQRAAATIDTPLGKLKVKIDNRKGTPTVKLKIPKGMSVEVVLPDGSCKSYRR